MPSVFTSVDACVDHIVATVGPVIRLGLPLGLGKPPELVNALYRRVKSDAALHLTVYTALSLAVPSPGDGLQGAFLRPFLSRVFGTYPGLDYVHDLDHGTLPPNVAIHEFFLRPGALLKNRHAQQRYISTNYTHASRDLLSHDINVVCQMIAHRCRDGRDEYSLACNPEISLELLPVLKSRREAGRSVLVIGQVHDDLPFMVNDAQIDATAFDAFLHLPRPHHTLFSTPRQPVSTVDYMIGLNASALVRDGGTLQIGIGSLGDALVYGCELRHGDASNYRALLDQMGLPQRHATTVDAIGGLGRFDRGLYGASEMFVPGFLRLMDAGILRRRVYDDVRIQRVAGDDDRVDEALWLRLLESGALTSPLGECDVETLVRFGIFRAGVRWTSEGILTPEGDLCSPLLTEDHLTLLQKCLGSRLRGGVVMHGGFFLGHAEFYERLRRLDDDTRAQINMTAIGKVNALYGDEALKRAQRRDARFINTVFMVHLLGAATSDGLEDGNVVSGVGGQYNFVAQAHELEGARSILMLKSTRTAGDATRSNIVFSYGHVTIPRHLRDVYVTEYGIADVRGRPDNEVVAALLNIADSRFQDGLLEKAQAAGKISGDYRIPEAFRGNTPERLEAIAMQWRARGLLPTFPAGSDFTAGEWRLATALKRIAARATNPVALGQAWWRSRRAVIPNPTSAAMLAHLGLETPRNVRERIVRQLLLDEYAGKHGAPGGI